MNVKDKVLKAAIDATMEELKAVSDVANQILKLSGAEAYSAVEDSTVECEENEVFAKIATIANEMKQTGKFVAIHLKYADFTFNERQVRVFLVLSNKTAYRGRREGALAHIEVWHADSKIELDYPKSQFELQNMKNDWTKIGCNDMEGFLE